MPKLAYAYCRECGRHRDDAGTLTRSRLCVACSTKRQNDNNLQIHFKSGPFYERRVYGMVRAELGPRVALALKQAGVFSSVLDDQAPAA